MITYGLSGILVVALAVRYVIAREYTVGEGCVAELWRAGVCDYDTWAQQYEFAVGDALVFNFSPGDSNVAEVTKTYYDMCSITLTPDISPKYVYKKSPQTIPLSTTGTFYFVNTLMCMYQRMAITVNATASESGAPAASGASHSLPASSSSSSSSSSSHNKMVEAVVGSVVAFILFTAKISIAVYCYRRRQQRHRLNAQGRPPNEAAPVLHHVHAHVQMNYQGAHDTQGVSVSNYNT